MPTIEQPVVKVVLFQHGAEPYFGPGSDRGQTWYSVLANDWWRVPPGSYSFGASPHNTASALEYLGKERCRCAARNGRNEKPLGMVLRPFIIPLDVDTFTALPGDGGTWTTLRSYINPCVTRLVQTYPGVNSSGTTTSTYWGRQSNKQHAANAILAFSVLPLAVSPEYNEVSGGAAFVRFSWASGLYGIHFPHNGNPLLVKLISGTYVPLMELHQPPVQSHGDMPTEIVGIIRIQRGGLAVSLDGGATYDVYFAPDGSAMSYPQGNYRFEGRGGAATLGIHQAIVYTGTFDSPKCAARPRSGSPALTVKGNAPAGTSAAVSASSLTGSADEFLRYRLTLTRGSTTVQGVVFYYSPEVYTVEVYHPPQPSAILPIGDDGAAFEGRILRLVIDKPPELSQARCTFTCRYTVTEGGPIGPFTGKKIQVYGGHLYDDGSSSVRLMFTGWIDRPEVRQHVGNFVEVTFSAQSVALRPKTMRYADYNCRPFDGVSGDIALSRWLAEMGLDDTYGITHPRLAARTLPAELPEEPAFMPSPNEDRWKLFAEEIVRPCRCELGVTDDGRFQVVPIDTWNPTGNAWHAAPAGESGYISELGVEQDWLGTCTAFVCRAKTGLGEAISAGIFDDEAEQNIFSNRFRPWPMQDTLTLEYPVDRGWLNTVTQGEAYEKLTPLTPASWKGELAHTIQRRDTVYLLGTTAGLSGAAPQVGVLALRHSFDAGKAPYWETELVGRQL